MRLWWGWGRGIDADSLTGMWAEKTFKNIRDILIVDAGMEMKEMFIVSVENLK